MNVRSITRVLFALVSLVALSMLLPAAVAFAYGENAVPFLVPPAVCALLWILRAATGKKEKVQLTIRGGILSVAGGWVFACLLGTIPFLATGALTSMTDAFFESVSGFTTTGATVIADVESLPRSINLWRMQTHWLGGMGIVVLTVALLPLLGVGGFQLIKSEITGPEKGKFTPKITETAKILWIIYAGLTAMQTILLMFAGMDFVDALSHSFATLGTGGFSSRNASIGSYNSAAIDWICAVFMLLSGVNFTLYFCLCARKTSEVVHNTELKAYLLIVAVAGLITSISLISQLDSVEQAFRAGFFHVISIITTTGFSTNDFTQWPLLAQTVLFLLMCVGGSSGSTAGGIKVIRWVIGGRQMTSEMRKMLHPHGIFGIRINGKSYSKDMVPSVMAFMVLYGLLVAVSTIVAAAAGSNLLTSFTASLAMVGNIGPGFDGVGPANTFAPFAPVVKWWFSFAMIAGRLELYTVMIFFLPSFWKK